jgi:hypothetical protein
VVFLASHFFVSQLLRIRIRRGAGVFRVEAEAKCFFLLPSAAAASSNPAREDVRCGCKGVKETYANAA